MSLRRRGDAVNARGCGRAIRGGHGFGFRGRVAPRLAAMRRCVSVPRMAKDIAPRGIAGEWIEQLKWNADGLVAVIAQQHDSNEVLMFAWATREAVERTIATGVATYFSRSRGGLWVKGETSGYKQRIIEIRVDCDGDAVLYRVDAPGPACHQLRRSCFSTRIDSDGSLTTDRPVIA
jgi:phosphoribosyl-AMP cyclohydrolase